MPFSEMTFPFIAGQEQYFIENLIEIETITYSIGDVRYGLDKSDRKAYQGSGRVNNINSLPASWWFERKLDGGTLFVYFFPQDNYPVIIWGKFSLSDVVLGQDLSLILDAFYIEYLRLALAEMLCADYNIVFQPQAYQKLNEYEGIIKDVSPPDMTMTRISVFRNQPGLTWGDVNIGRGYRPGSR